MKSCVYNGKVCYITKLEDFRDVMEHSVYECLENFIEDLLIRERVEGYKEAQDEFESIECNQDLKIENDELLNEVSELEQDLLDMEYEKNDILKTIDTAIKNYSYTEDHEELIRVLEELL